MCDNGAFVSHTFLQELLTATFSISFLVRGLGVKVDAMTPIENVSVSRILYFWAVFNRESSEHRCGS